MTKRFIINKNNLPIKFPLTFTLALCLCLDRIGAPSWLWGVAATLMVILWMLIWSMQKDQKQVDIFHEYDEKEPENEKVKKSFQERLKEKAAAAGSKTL